ncbi:C4-dicarboxylate TRAP transporter substrate-binding protein [Paracoccus seriniphilus]|uniref:TRAP-type C4-dicarboxylate transport system, substrate-binding protein n=1 Tax=Paracoccus seriniphilus TaxID=184748 RepID=A0A239Q3W7_9RHOB|nr:C4-dicarboxylate TRAP transporter substrate-binding protein [Paracoccus seriniphilus]WCR15621.1 C4-dicarboxylate TRAP transporter substrate-binding protein [Paracoccus seriniphilus]SNT76647.1 TRAP-type C4-dicarboxylate transport system, substrate-binding protein [Paracoccus seriniphilus]
MMNYKALALLSTILYAAFPGDAAQAETLRYAIGFPPGGSVTDGLHEFNDRLKAETDLELKIYELSLLDLKETPPGVRDGLADAGYIITPYYAAEYSETNLPANMSMLATVGTPAKSSGAVMAGVMTEYVMLHCDECQQQYKAQNQIFLGAIGTPEYVQLCTTPIRSIEDLKGKKMRSSVDAMGRWAENFGATKVSIPANDIYEAMSQGVVDCTMFSAPELGNFQLFDVTKYITLGLPGGSFAGVGAMNVNLDTWQSLSKEQRSEMLRLAPFNAAAITVNYHRAAEQDIEKARQNGTEIIERPEAMAKATEEFVRDDAAVIKASFQNDYGLENVDEKYDLIAGLIEKWKGLTEDSHNDKDAMTELLWTEVFSKMDAATYGMN